MSLCSGCCGDASRTVLCSYRDVFGSDVAPITFSIHVMSLSNPIGSERLSSRATCFRKRSNASKFTPWRFLSCSIMKPKRISKTRESFWKLTIDSHLVVSVASELDVPVVRVGDATIASNRFIRVYVVNHLQSVEQGFTSMLQQPVVNCGSAVQIVKVQSCDQGAGGNYRRQPRRQWAARLARIGLGRSSSYS